MEESGFGYTMGRLEGGGARARAADLLRSRTTLTVAGGPHTSARRCMGPWQWGQNVAAFFELGNQSPSLPPPPSASPAPEHQISVLCSNGPEGTYWTAFFDAGISRIRFGRAEDNDLQLDTPEASRYHGAFVARGDTWVVEDYGSANGTLVDGQRVAKEAAISRMSTVNVGRTSMTLRWSAAAAEYTEAPTERPPSPKAAARVVGPLAPQMP